MSEFKRIIAYVDGCNDTDIVEAVQVNAHRRLLELRNATISPEQIGSVSADAGLPGQATVDLPPPVVLSAPLSSTYRTPRVVARAQAAVELDRGLHDRAIDLMREIRGDEFRPDEPVLDLYERCVRRVRAIDNAFANDSDI